MEESTASPFRNAMNYGAVLGVALILFSTVFHLIGLQDSFTQSLLSYLSVFAIIFMGTKAYRDHDHDGYISYGSALGMGTLIAFFGSIIIGFYFYIYISFIDTNFVQLVLEKAEEQMINSGKSEDEIEIAMKYSKMILTPGLFAFFTMLGYTFFGFIFSLVTSAILKKEDQSFESHFK